MNEQGERIAKLEAHLESMSDAVSRMEKKLDASLQRHETADRKLAAYEHQLKGARWVFSILLAIGAFFGFKVGVITLGTK